MTYRVYIASYTDEQLIEALLEAYPESYFVDEAANRLERNIPMEVTIRTPEKYMPSKYYCPVCGKQQKRGKHGIWYCERCGQALKKTITLEVGE